MNDELYDAVVVGAGAAGLNAALVPARARRRVAVVDAGSPRNAPAAHMHGFLSRDGMSPRALIEAGRAELDGYGVGVIDARVEHIETRRVDFGSPRFWVRLEGGPALRARHVIAATGLRDELPDIPGVRERWGRDVVFCPYCHGYEVRDEPIGVLGTHPNAVNHALLLRQWSGDVALFPHALRLTGEEHERLAARGVRGVDGTVKRPAVREDRLHGVELVDGFTTPRRAIFLFPRMTPNGAVLNGLGCATEDGRPGTDRAGRTSVPGVWAVGNLADPRALVVTAAGMGAAAAFALNHDLVDEEVARAVGRDRTAR